MNRDTAVLLIYGARHYLYYWTPPAIWGDVFNLTTAAIMLGVLACMRPHWLVAAWAITEEAQLIGCGIWWLIDPWIVEVGQDRCSARLDIKVSLFGLTALAFLTFRQAVKSYSMRETRGNR